MKLVHSLGIWKLAKWIMLLLSNFYTISEYKCRSFSNKRNLYL